MTQKGLPSLPAGTLFRARYRIMRLIKAGGQGAVYEVKDETTNRPRALKVMLPSLVDDADMRARFELEARVTGDIESDHLVRISDVGIDEASGAPFMVMDLLRGEDLQSVLTKRGAIPPSEALDYLAQTARVLDKTHAANIVHRDLKPDNLFVTSRDDGSPCIKILDFGIAKVIAQANAKKTRALGTPLYMAPEQVRGDPTIGLRVDVLALAHVAYTLLTGSPYWLEDAQADPSLAGLIMKIMGGVQESPVARALRRSGIRLPPEFEGWFRRATALSPDDRFESAGALIAALNPIVTSMQAPAAAPANTMAVEPAHLVAPYGPAHSQQTGQVPTGQTWSAPMQAAPAPYGQTGPVYAPQAGASPTGPTYPGQTYGQSAPQVYNPAPGYAPNPVAPPQKTASFPLVPILAGMGCLGFLVFVLILVAAAGSSNSPNVTPLPANACGAAAACVATDVSDIKHVDALERLPKVQALAKNVDSSAKLLSITATHAQRDGTTDLTGNKSIAYGFLTSKNEWISIYVQEKLTSAYVSPATTNNSTPIPEPHCKVKQVVDAAVKNGFPFKGTATVFHVFDFTVNTPRWSVFDANGNIRYVDDKTCQ